MLSEDEIRVLEKWLTFCPVTQIDKFEVTKDVHLFVCNLLLKSLFAKKQDAGGPTHKKTELEAIDNLTVLLEENEPEDLIDSLDLEAILAEVDGMISAPPPPKSNMVALKKKSSLYPAHSSKPNTEAFFKLVSKDIQNLKYSPQEQGNLTNGEHRAL